MTVADGFMFALFSLRRFRAVFALCDIVVLDVKRCVRLRCLPFDSIILLTACRISQALGHFSAIGSFLELDDFRIRKTSTLKHLARPPIHKVMLSSKPHFRLGKPKKPTISGLLSSATGSFRSHLCIYAPGRPSAPARVNCGSKHTSRFPFRAHLTRSWCGHGKYALIKPRRWAGHAVLAACFNHPAIEHLRNPLATVVGAGGAGLLLQCCSFLEKRGVINSV